MAPLKRNRRVVQHDDDDEAAHTHEASSSLQNTSSRKRTRLSLDEPKENPRRHARRHSPAESSNNESESENASEAPKSPPQTQYEVMRDNGFRHLQHIDRDDQQATQKLMRRAPTRLGDNMSAESGIVESITCINFMCHERLHVELGPLINFIVGENGSGKSAVLTALTLCLGGKASDTNRGGSIRSFVKEGQERGKLAVKIKNAGSDAYMAHIYGESITVERHFSKSGAGGFKILSAASRIISTKKQEVDEITEHYALQINNPLTVLSQDNARQFLNAASPAQKYKYFISGVQLEQLDNDYKLSQDTLDKTLMLRDDLTSRVTHLQREAEAAQRLSETAEKNQNIREKARHYRNQLIWSQVVEQERALEAREAALSGRDAQIAEAEAECDDMTKALLSAEEKLERVTTARSAVETERDAFEEKITNAERLYHSAKKDLTELHREERDVHARLKAAQEDIKRYEERIEEETRRLGEATGSVRSERDAELLEAKRRQASLTGQITDNKAQESELQDELVKVKERAQKSREVKDKKRSEVVVSERQLRQLEQRTGSPFDGFDNTMIALVDAISRDKGFQSKPVGPFGAHIKLAKPEWSGIIEKTLGDALNAFVVTSKQDQSRLASMIRRMNMSRDPPIFIARGGRIDTSQQEPDTSFDTILRVLEFEHDIIRTQLIINNQIEKIILVEQRTEALKLMGSNSPPRNVSACLSFHDGMDKRGQGVRFTNRGSSCSTGPVIPTGQRPRMRSETGRQVSLQKDHVKQLGSELRGLANAEKQLQQTVRDSQSSIDAHLKSRKSLERDLRQTEAEIERVSSELDAFEGVDDRLVGLRAGLEAKCADENSIGAQWGNMQLEKRELNRKTEAAKQNLEAQRKDGADFEHRLNKASEKVQSCESMRRIAVAKKNEAFEKLGIERNERRRDEEKKNAKVVEVEEFTRQAQGIVPDRVHIPEGETHASIEKKYEKLRDQLAQRERRLGATDQEIHDRAAEARSQYESVTSQVEDVDDTIGSLKLAIEHRLDLWRQFQRQISARIRIQFNYLLSERGFRGRIELDHRAKKVNVQIEPDETKKSATGRNTKTLSGGEKSFSSICMLLSVWEAIGSPMRCLDEFDVFMDNVNRAISTNMLVSAARRSVSKQYILITPNAIEGRARLDKDVTIIRLTDPRQRTLF